MLHIQIQKAKQDYDHAVRLRKEGGINTRRENMHKKILVALETAQKKIDTAQTAYYK